METQISPPKKLSTRRKQRLRLWTVDSRCHWCKIETVLPEGTNDKRPNVATIDHLYSKHHPKRLTPNTTGEIRHVLACWKCNQRRGKEDNQAFFKGIARLRRALPLSLRVKKFASAIWRAVKTF